MKRLRKVHLEQKREDYRSEGEGIPFITSQVRNSSLFRDSWKISDAIGISKITVCEKNLSQ
jgi:hypothetical protein